VRHEGTVEVRGRIREEAGDIADCPDPSGRIADLTARNTARRAATEGNEPRISRISRIKKIFQCKVAKAQRRKEGKNSLRLCAAPLRLTTACPSAKKSSRRSAILTDCSAKNTKKEIFLVLQSVRIAQFREDFTTDYTDYTDKELLVSAIRLLLFFPIRVIRVIRGKFLWLRLCRVGSLVSLVSLPSLPGSVEAPP